MKIALIGYGKMGQCIEQHALMQGHEIAVKLGRFPLSTEIRRIEQVDVCIDFSRPDAVLKNMKALSGIGKPIVMGTTGWLDDFSEISNIVQSAGIGLIWSPNFSLGVHLYLEIITEAAKLINAFDQYDIGGHETHHSQKADTPSGTAIAIADKLLQHISRKKIACFQPLDRPPQAEEIHFSSLRTGSIPGTHTIIFDSPCDSIELTHKAKNRNGFALGALAAAEWIIGKKGLFTMDDLIEALLKKETIC